MGAGGRPAAGGGRRVEIDPERLHRWLDECGRRHGGWTQRVPGPEAVLLSARDGSTVEVEVPFPPLTVPAAGAPALPYAGVVEHALVDRRVGVLLVRRGGHAAGVLAGSALVLSKVGSRHVQGRTAAGGWSQQRFARRREGQTRQAVDAAAEVAARILVPELPALSAVVTGGDRALLAAVLADARLAQLRAIVAPRILDVPDPRLAVLAATPRAVRAVTVRIRTPEDAGS